MRALNGPPFMAGRQEEKGAANICLPSPKSKGHQRMMRIQVFLQRRFVFIYPRSHEYEYSAGAARCLAPSPTTRGTFKHFQVRFLRREPFVPRFLPRSAHRGPVAAAPSGLRGAAIGPWRPALVPARCPRSRLRAPGPRLLALPPRRGPALQLFFLHASGSAEKLVANG